jgi:integrase
MRARGVHRRRGPDFILEQPAALVVQATGHCVWRRAIKLVGPVDAHFHDLRHFAASDLIASGASVKTVQHFLGHASAKVTLDTYAHLWPDDEDRTRNALDSALASVVVAPDRRHAAAALA